MSIMPKKEKMKCVFILATNTRSRYSRVKIITVTISNKSKIAIVVSDKSGIVPIEKLINDYQAILDRDPLSQSEDTYSILLKFTQALATELGEIVVQDPIKDGIRMYFDEKIARYVIKKSVGL